MNKLNGDTIKEGEAICISVSVKQFIKTIGVNCVKTKRTKGFYDMNVAILFQTQGSRTGIFNDAHFKYFIKIIPITKPMVN